MPDEPIPPSPTFGGESLSDIYTRLVIHSKEENLPDGSVLSEQAQAIFSCKRQILLRMDELDPGGGWLENGAPFLRNQKSGGEQSLHRLNPILTNLERQGLTSFDYQALVKRKHR